MQLAMYNAVAAGQAPYPVRVAGDDPGGLGFIPLIVLAPLAAGAVIAAGGAAYGKWAAPWEQAALQTLGLQDDPQISTMPLPGPVAPTTDQLQQGSWTPGSAIERTQQMGQTQQNTATAVRTAEGGAAGVSPTDPGQSSLFGDWRIWAALGALAFILIWTRR